MADCVTTPAYMVLTTFFEESAPKDVLVFDSWSGIGSSGPSVDPNFEYCGAKVTGWHLDYTVDFPADARLDVTVFYTTLGAPTFPDDFDVDLLAYMPPPSPGDFSAVDLGSAIVPADKEWGLAEGGDFSGYRWVNAGALGDIFPGSIGSDWLDPACELAVFGNAVSDEPEQWNPHFPTPQVAQLLTVKMAGLVFEGEPGPEYNLFFADMPVSDVSYAGVDYTVLAHRTRKIEDDILHTTSYQLEILCQRVGDNENSCDGGGGDLFLAQLIGSIGPFTLLARAVTPQPCPLVGRQAESCVEGFSSVPPGVRQIVSGRDDVLTHCDHGHVRPARGIASGIGEALGYAYAFSEGVAEADSIGIALGFSDFAHAIDARGDATGTGTAFAVGSSIAAALAEAAGIGDASGISSAAATIEAIGAADGIGTADAIAYIIAAAIAAAAASGEALAIGEAVTGTTIVSAVAVAVGVGGSIFDDGQAIVEAVAAAVALGDAFGTSQASVTVSAHGDAQGLGLAQAIARSTVAAVATAAGIGDAQSYSDAIATIESVGSAAGIGVAAATALSTVAGDGTAAGTGEALGIGAIAIHINAAVAAASGTGAAAGISAGSVSQAVAAAAGTGSSNARGNAIVEAVAAAQGSGLAAGTSPGGTISAAVGQADGVSNARATGRAIAGARAAAQGLGAAQAMPLATIAARASASATGAAAGIGADGGAIIINLGCNLISDTVVRTIPAQTKPAYLGSYIDPTYGTLVTRVSGDPGTAIPVAGGTWPTEVRNGYNKRQPWNCDESILYIEVGGLLLDGQTYHVIASTSARGKPSGEVRWHPTNPALMYNTSGSVFQLWNVNTGAKTVLHTFTGYGSLSIGQGEGNLSLNGDWIAISATRTSDGHEVVFAYQISSDTKHPDIDTTALYGTGLRKNSTVSPLHNYILITHDDDRIQLFNLDATSYAVWTEYSKPGHADLTVDANGDEVVVGTTKTSPPTTGSMIKRRLRDGVVTTLETGGWVSHTSTRDTGLAAPWAFGTHQSPSGRSLYDGELTAAATDGSKVFRLCYHHDTDVDYPSEVHGAASPSGTRVAFASNWGDASGRPVQAYVVDLRTVCAVSTGGTQAAMADLFADSIGLVVHFSFQSPADSYWRPEYSSDWLQFIRDLNVRYYRTSLTVGASAASTTYVNSLFVSDGTKFNVVINPVTLGVVDFTKIADHLDNIENNIGVEKVISIEGLNEVQHNISGDWAQISVDFMQEMQRQIRLRPAFDNIPIIGPSIWERSTSAIDTVLTKNGGLGWGPYVDLQSIHNYTGGRKPTLTTIDDDLTGTTTVTLVDMIADNQRLVQGRPDFAFTEAGYNTVSAPWIGGDPGPGVISAAAQSKYLSRAFLENYNAGASRTFIYALLNNFTATFYGIKNNNKTLEADNANTGPPYTYLNRPAFTTIQRIMTAMSNPGTPFTPARLNYSFSGADGSDSRLHHRLFQKRNGVFQLLLAWDDVSWLRTSPFGDIDSSGSVTLNIGANASLVRVTTPHTTGTYTTVGTNVSRVSLTVPDHLMIVEITL